MVGYNCFIIFQYHYLNIKILKFSENFLYFSRSIALMDKIPCTGNDATGNQYRVTGGI
jgi:hypothetical protein